jgi:hypothetical protein
VGLRRRESGSCPERGSGLLGEPLLLGERDDTGVGPRHERVGLGEQGPYGVAPVGDRPLQAGGAQRSGLQPRRGLALAGHLLPGVRGGAVVAVQHRADLVHPAQRVRQVRARQHAGVEPRAAPGHVQRPDPAVGLPVAGTGTGADGIELSLGGDVLRHGAAQGVVRLVVVLGGPLGLQLQRVHAGTQLGGLLARVADHVGARQDGSGLGRSGQGAGDQGRGQNRAEHRAGNPAPPGSRRRGRFTRWGLLRPWR